MNPNPFLAFCLILFLGLSCNSQEKNTLVRYTSFEDFEPELSKKDEKVHVVNFWATWCKPCIAELPYFEKLNKHYKSKGVEVSLVSLDFENQIDSRLLPFIEKHMLQSRVVVLLDGKPNNWIDKVDEEWSGSIPATVIYNRDEWLFLEQEFEDYQELEGTVLPFLNQNNSK